MQETPPNWISVALSNGFPRSTAYDLVARGHVEDAKRGGARAKRTKVTAEVRKRLEGYLDEDCTYTLEQMTNMVFIDCNGLRLSTSTISRHLVGMLYTVKQTRIEPSTCNNEENKLKRQKFANALLKHQRDGNCIVYYDETNYNVYCKRGQGRAKKGKRATVVLPPSKGANLQLQCAVNSIIGLVHYRMQRGSIKMDANAAFVEEVYQSVKASEVFQKNYQGKKVVIVLDNAPAHNQTEIRVIVHEDMVLLRLAPYSPMCNPIEGCFSKLKAEIKKQLTVDRPEICDRRRRLNPDGSVLTLAERQMRILERAARAYITCMTPALVTHQELHCLDAVMAAKTLQDMTYGT